MKITYTVISVHEAEVAVTASVQGRDVVAKVPGLVVDLASEDGSMGHTLRLTPEDVEEAKALFPVGAKVMATYSAIEE